MAVLATISLTTVALAAVSLLGVGFWAPGAVPVLGALPFFSERWDWYKRAIASSKSGNFSFHVGPFPVVGLACEASRQIFHETKGLGFTEGYLALLGGGTSVQCDTAVAHDGKPEDDEGNFAVYFKKRLVMLMKGNNLQRRLPLLLKDAKQSLDALAADPSGITNPYESIYRIVFQLTMRTVAADEIADDPARLVSCLHHFETIEGSGNALAIMYPWLPTLSTTRRTYAGAQMYLMFKSVMDDRRKHNRRGDDALQFLMDQGDSVKDIIAFVLGSLVAGQLNSGINAAYIVSCLANDRYWMDRVTEEVNNVADRYHPDQSVPLRDRLMSIPADAWEGEFPVVDLCLKDSIRLNSQGTAFRQNISGHDIPLDKAGTEVIPAGAYVALANADTYHDPNIYPQPERWDPRRYLAPRHEDKKAAYAWSGWGSGRHPCLGMRLAKLQISMIVAFFVVYFDDLHLADKHGNPTDRVPFPGINGHTAVKPAEKVWIKYRVRQGVI